MAMLCGPAIAPDVIQAGSTLADCVASSNISMRRSLRTGLAWASDTSLPVSSTGASALRYLTLNYLTRA